MSKKQQKPMNSSTEEPKDTKDTKLLYKQGTLFKKSKSFWKSGWREKHFVLSGSSLYYYEKSTTEASQGVIQLSKTKILGDINNEKRKYVFGLQTGEKIVLLAAKNETEFEDWTKTIQSSFNLPATPPPDRGNKHKKAKVTSQLIEAATNLSAVRKMIKEFVPSNTFVIMAAVKRFISHADSPNQAEALEIMVLQLAAKVALLYKDKKITREYLVPIIQPLHNVCDKLIDGYEIPFAFSVSDVIIAIKELQIVMDQLLKPLLPEKAMKDLSALLEYLANEELLNDFFTKKKWKETKEVCVTLRNLWEDGLV